MKIAIDISEEDLRKVKDGRASVAMMRKAILDGFFLKRNEDNIYIPYEDAISRKEAISIASIATLSVNQVVTALNKLPHVTPQETVTEFADRCRECGKMKRCKDCRYFEYDSWANVNGIPLIVAHEICKRWGDGCKTSENGYCFLFEPKEDEDERKTEIEKA